MMKKALLAGWITIFLCSMPFSVHAKSRSVEVFSKTYTIDRKYKSMEGPQSTQTIQLPETSVPELLWITGYRAVVIDSEGAAPISQEFMCHSNLDFSDVIRHNKMFGRNETARVFTLSQGEVSTFFPAGFGIPILSGEPLSLTTQVLNHNIENQKFHVKYRVTLDFVRDGDLKTPFRPLFTRGAYGMVLLEGRDGFFGIEDPDTSVHGTSCLLGQNASTYTYEDTFSRKFAGHWVVKPGREVNHTLVTKVMDIPFNTTIHYIAVHLHPFAESLELRDVTTGKSLFKSRARGYKNKIGIATVDHYSSRAGIAVTKDHDYEIVSVYNNTSGVDQDAMAVMYLYLLNKEFRRPSLTLKR